MHYLSKKMKNKKSFFKKSKLEKKLVYKFNDIKFQILNKNIDLDHCLIGPG